MEGAIGYAANILMDNIATQKLERVNAISTDVRCILDGFVIRVSRNGERETSLSSGFIKILRPHCKVPHYRPQLPPFVPTAGPSSRRTREQQPIPDQIANMRPLSLSLSLAPSLSPSLDVRRSRRNCFILIPTD